MITNQQFVEVLKSLTKEDFDTTQKIVSDLYDNFDGLSTREMFTENEIEGISNLLESYSDEVKVAVLVCKFKEGL